MHCRPSAQATSRPWSERSPRSTGCPGRRSAPSPYGRRHCCTAPSVGSTMRKPDRRHNQEVHRADACRMVVQKGLPGLRSPSPAPRHVLGNCRLRDFNPELQQFTMDAWCAPQPVRQAHLPDQAADLPWYPRPTAPSARLPAPIQSEPHPMPPDDGLRLDNRHGVQHRRKQPIELNEEQSVRHRQLRFRGYALTQHTQLVSQQHNLGFQSRLRLEWRDQDVDEQDQERDHHAISLADLATHASPDEVLGMDRVGPSITLQEERIVHVKNYYANHRPT